MTSLTLIPLCRGALTRVAQGLYLAQQARQLQESQAAASAPAANAATALYIQNEAQLQRSIAQHSPTAARVPPASAHAIVSQDLVSVQVDSAPAESAGEVKLLYWHDISAAGKEELPSDRPHEYGADTAATKQCRKMVTISSGPAARRVSWPGCRPFYFLR